MCTVDKTSTTPNALVLELAWVLAWVRVLAQAGIVARSAAALDTVADTAVLRMVVLVDVAAVGMAAVASGVGQDNAAAGRALRLRLQAGKAAAADVMHIAEPVAEVGAAGQAVAVHCNLLPLEARARVWARVQAAPCYDPPSRPSWPASRPGCFA